MLPFKNKLDLTINSQHIYKNKHQLCDRLYIVITVYRMANKIIILIIFALNIQNILSEELDDNCTLNNEIGVCKLLKNCARVVDELNHEGKMYTKCTEEYVGLNPVVCCLPTKAEIDVRIPDEWMRLPISERSIWDFLYLLQQNVLKTIFYYFYRMS